VQSIARALDTSPLTVVIVEGMLQLLTLDVLERALAEREALVAAAPTDEAKLAALERDANFGRIIRELGAPLDAAIAGLYLRGTEGDEHESKVGLGGVGLKGTVQSRAMEARQGGGSAMVAFGAPLSLQQQEPEGGRRAFDELNHMRKLLHEGIEAQVTLLAGSAACLHAVSMAGDPRSDPLGAAASTHKVEVATENVARAARGAAPMTFDEQLSFVQGLNGELKHLRAPLLATASPATSNC